MTSRRLPEGGRIDRTNSLKIYFDDRELCAYRGDTLASALLACGESVVGRSFKYHRPRGVYSAGVEEPNALVHLRSGSRNEPNTRATMIEAYEGLKAWGQNAWPSVRWDLNALIQLLTPFLGAGFYYKTFVGPFQGTAWWMFFERFIRKAAGMGSGTTLSDPDNYEKINAFCDVLVIGAGPAGLSAALAAGRAGAQVILVEQDSALGGSLLSMPAGSDSDAWLKDLTEELSAMENVRILNRTTAFGAYDSDVYGLVERAWDHVAVPPEGQPRQRYWLVRTKQTVMATGAIERPLVFGGNDRPGVMLAGAARTYVNRYAILPGERVLVATNNDSAYGVALDLARAGASVKLVDARQSLPEELVLPLQSVGVLVFPGHGVLVANGRSRVTAATIAPIGSDGRAIGPQSKIDCDLIAVSGGWSPVVHLLSQRQHKPVFDKEKLCFVPPADHEIASMKFAGSANAANGLDGAIRQGFDAGIATALDAGAKGSTEGRPTPPEAPIGDDWTRDPSSLWAFSGENGKATEAAFLDLQHDVKLSDIDLAYREGYVSVEHLKRYTTTGMATDQGKLSNVSALFRMADLRGVTIPEVGITTYRPPFTPISLGAIVGREHGKHYSATRLSPIHDWHVLNGAILIEAGAWMRPWYYPHGDENLRTAYVREAAHVRKHVGMIDISTLGKIAVQGPDAAELLNRIYVNGWKKLAVGRLRYGIMLREDGFVLDDGATARLGEFDYFMSTTTANAAKVLALIEHFLQSAWRDLEVQVTSITDQWAAIALAGPKSRDLLSTVSTGVDLSRAALPNNHFTYGQLADVDVRIHRMSYSGELAYEVYVPSGHALRVWEALSEAGKPFNLNPYGTEAMGALRIEKGHVAGPELDGRTTLKDLGLEEFASKKKSFVGSVLKNRSALTDPTRPSLVGLEIEGNQEALAGSLLYSADEAIAGHGDGWVSSATFSPALSKNIGLALLKNGPQRMGEVLRIVNLVGGTILRAKVTSPHFFDHEGERQNA